MFSILTRLLDIYVFATFTYFRSLDAAPLESIGEYQIIYLKQNGRPYSAKNSYLINNEIQYSETINFDFSVSKMHYEIKLFKNQQLITPGFKIFEQNFENKLVSRKRGTSNCYYQGYIGDDSNSTVVVADTCNGLRSYVRDKNGLEYAIKPLDENKTTFSSEHIFYRLNRTQKNPIHRCGFHNTVKSDSIFTLDDTPKNSTYTFSDSLTYSIPSYFGGISRKFGQMTNNLKKDFINQKKYISVIVILDNLFYEKYGDRSEEQALGIMNNADTIYKYVNTRLAIQALMIWKYKDLIDVSSDSGKTLSRLNTYAHDILFGKMDLNADSIVFITGKSLDEHIVGLAGVGTMCTSRSCALVEAYTQDMVRVGDTVAHEIGHTLGFTHNNNKCTCSAQPCVMRATAPSRLAKGFSDCAQKVYEERLNNGKLTCLFDYPSKLYGKPKCGNGFLEEGEACDCGSEEECRSSGVDKCCDAKTCTLQETAKCATGQCCENCQFKVQGTLCRKPYDKDCDLSEYCTGESQHCPANTYVMDGNACLSDQGSCYHGSCITLDEQCQTLWGPNAVAANERCFNLNTHKNDSYSNCGGKENDFKSCARQDIYCGKIQCTSKDPSNPIPKFPIIGEELGGRKVKIIFMSHGVKCHMAYVPFEKDMKDPSMVKAGTKCGFGKMCQKQKCRNTTEINQFKANCKAGCYNGGVCNNKGNCHCPPGFACPDCKHLGLGGSKDSGQGCVVVSALSATTKAVIGTCTTLVILVGVLSFLIVKKREFLKAYREELRIRWLTSKSTGKPVWTISKGKTEKECAGPSNNQSAIANKYVTSSQNDLRIDVHPPPKISISDIKGPKLTVSDIKSVGSPDSVPPVKLPSGNKKSPKAPLKPPTTSRDKSRTPSPTPNFKINPIETVNKKRQAPQPVKRPSPLPPKKSLPPEPQNNPIGANVLKKAPKSPSIPNRTPLDSNSKPSPPNKPSSSNDTVVKADIAPKKPLVPPPNLKPKLSPIPNPKV